MISLSNTSVAADAIDGTIVGVIRVTDETRVIVPSNLTLTSSSAGYFSVADGNLVTRYHNASPGFYAIAIQTSGIRGAYEEEGRFVIEVMAAERK